jgi:SAM-dependent methyltransferase
VDEFKWDRPSSPNELNWFYRSQRGYLFGNASRPEWEALLVLDPKEHRTVLDFGGGIGQNVLALVERGFPSPWYFDISIMQAEFVRFRVKTRKAEVYFAEPYYNGRFNYLDCLPGGFNAILCQDVLEHIPRYPVVLEALAGKLLPGGLLVEYSPFNGKAQGKKMPRHSPVHLSEAVPLEKVMTGLGLQKTTLAPYPSTAWRKGEPA